jgi:hypothetical protein
MDLRGGNYKARRGFLIPVILVVLSILVVLGFTLHQMSQHQLKQVSHAARREVLYHWASSGLDLTLDALKKTADFLNDTDSSTRPKRLKAAEGIQPFLDLFLDPQGDFEISEEKLEWIPPVPIKDAYSESAPSVKVQIELRGIRPVYAGLSGPGLKLDESECRFWIHIRSEASDLLSKISVSGFSVSMLVQIQPSILGKFVLLLRTKGGLNLNSITDSTELTNLNAYPVSVFSGDSIPPDNSMTMTSAAELLDSRGWIFLGGADPWNFRLGNGGGEDSFASGMIPGAIFHSSIPPDEPLHTEPELSYVWSLRGVFPELGSSNQFSKSFDRVPASQLKHSTTLNLQGTQAQPSPTLVLGSTLLNYALLQGIHNENTGKTFYLPWLTEPEFMGTDWPAGGAVALVQYLKGNYLNNYSNYKRRMSGIEVQEINERNLSLVDLGSSKSVVDPATISPVSIKDAESVRLSAAGFPVHFFEKIHSTTHKVANDRGEVMWEGSNLGSLSDLQFLSARARMIFPDGPTFINSMESTGGVLKFPGGILWVRSDLELNRELLVEPGKGGILIVDSGIKIKNSIQTSGGEPLSLVSLGEGIRVQTAQELQCGLIALQGAMSLPPAFTIRGMLAARELELRSGSGSGNREIYYNDRFDPTDSTNYKNHFRLLVSGPWHRFVE